MTVGSNINANAQAFVDQVFRPMANELRRFLEEKLADTGANEDTPILTRVSVSSGIGVEPLAGIDSTVSLGLNVSRAGASETAAVMPFAQRLVIRPANIEAAARNLSKAIAEQIEQLNASKPNDPERLTKQNEFITFLERIASGLDSLSDALGKAVARVWTHNLIQ